MSNDLIYLDHHATTPVDPVVLEAMLPYFTEVYGNAASTDHIFGTKAYNAVENARSQIARAIDASPEEIIFTSGATESNNLALKGVAESYKKKGNHIITCVTEHPAVLDTCKELERNGFDVTYLPVNHQGIIDLDLLKNSIRNNTILITIMAANNEIGVLAPLIKIGQLARDNDIFFHTDATQAIGYVPISVDKMNIDLLSISGHKIYGPKGVGALYVRKISPRVKLHEQIHGGGHERGMRSGTHNVPGIVGLGEAMRIAVKLLPSEVKRLTKLRDKLFADLKTELENIELNGHETYRLPNNLNIYLPKIDARSLIVQLNNRVALSTGSACSTAKVIPSHVISALNLEQNRASNSIRLGLGRFTTVHELSSVAKVVSEQVKNIINISFV